MKKILIAQGFLPSHVVAKVVGFVGILMMERYVLEHITSGRTDSIGLLPVF
jgi:hypothetical protein